MTSPDRRLQLAVSHNVRHIGWYRGSRGETPADIVRAAGLQRLTEGGIASLADAGVRTVVDLRSSRERNAQATPDMQRFGIRNVHNPLWEDDASPAGLSKDFAGYVPVYETMLSSGGAAYRRLFELIATSEDGVLFHCAAGKDRTGVAAALLLSLAGVSEEEIVADYALSEVLLEPMFGEFLPGLKARGLDETKARGMLASPPDTMRQTLAHVATRYGSAEGFMREIGMGEAALNALKSRLAV